MIKDEDHTAELKRRLKQLRKRKIQVGILGDAELARNFATNEFGATIKTGTSTIIIPERSTLRVAFDDKKVINRVVKEATNFFDITEDPKRIMDRIGLLMVAAVQRKIRSNTPPPNAPSTIKAKGGKTKTLINTGRTLQAVTHEII